METIVQGENVHRFEAAYNRIHNKLMELVSKSSDHAAYGEVLQAARKLHNVVRYNYDTLKQFGKLRNALVHRKVRQDFYIAEPHQEIVQEIERICELMYEPPLALSIASQPVTSFHPTTSIQTILEAINDSGFSQFPIVNEIGFHGLLTEGGIAKWLSCNIIDSLVSLHDVTAKDILEYEKPHNVKFLDRNSSIYDLEAIFETSFDDNKKLEAILITHSGSKKQKPIGIVTSWDLVKIDHANVTIASHV
ncbi:CBS domain-containing protein [Aquibacillus kalidii]|uniref:CBS domain-containing protein n=1 Tax=Aquibacillus kalidii TaxID=2762597 RepID=UPI001647223B|nr:CBS domain-containing protein [Aquibacillus kalidii]